MNEEHAAGSDEEVVAESIGDPSLFALLFDRHYDHVWRYACRRAGTAVADEQASEVFVRARRPVSARSRSPAKARARDHPLPRRRGGTRRGGSRQLSLRTLPDRICCHGDWHRRRLLRAPGLGSATITVGPSHSERTSNMITKLDFVAIPSQDAERTRRFYAETLGLRLDKHAKSELWLGETCLAIWEPARFGMEFVPQKNAHLALHVDDVATARGELEARGVTFAGETLDTGVCRMAFFTDPDGNDLMLHHRYAPYD
jgi:catechol 2,3-dioxygenase-like lactoylglutathione lyase family enzyme